MEKKFKRGDQHPSGDGKRFWCYYKIKSSPNRQEKWVTSEKFVELKETERKKAIAHYYKHHEAFKVQRQNRPPEWKKKERERLKQYAKDHPEETSASKKKYWLANQDKIKKANRAYQEANKEKIAARCKRYKKENKDKIAASSKIYRASHRKQARDYQRKRRKEPNVRLMGALRSDVYYALRKQSASKKRQTFQLVGCTGAELMEYLLAHESNDGSFAADNYGKAWHVDHIRPCASFDLTDHEQQKECFHYTNLQPLDPIENTVKGSLWKGEKYLHK